MLILDVHCGRVDTEAGYGDGDEIPPPAPSQARGHTVHPYIQQVYRLIGDWIDHLCLCWHIVCWYIIKLEMQVLNAQISLVQFYLAVYLINVCLHNTVYLLYVSCLSTFSMSSWPSELMSSKPNYFLWVSQYTSHRQTLLIIWYLKY